MPAIKRKTISILGCGWLGLELARELSAEGYLIKGSTTSPDKLNTVLETGAIPYLLNFQEDKEDFDIRFFDCDLLVISIPPGRSNAGQHTFLTKIQKIAHVATTQQVSNILFISSTSVYGDGNAEVTERSSPSPDTASGKAILESEIYLEAQPGFTTTIIRFGGLVGPGRDPGRFFAGKKDIPNGNAPVNLIHQSDCIGLLKKIIELEAFGHIYNACSPEHPSRKEFYTQASLRSGLELPEFTDELLSWKLVKSIHVPAHLGYVFKTKINTAESQ
ncbi:SDR family oxidoreductase [Pedobacter sp. AW31-3R]|uniref:SDR family oxidoreductase n=1 Tax=Pedobacter sp. AW31-3R TaxID=3445781 RepID=UPI003F9F996A